MAMLPFCDDLPLVIAKNINDEFLKQLKDNRYWQLHLEEIRACGKNYQQICYFMSNGTIPKSYRKIRNVLSGKVYFDFNIIPLSFPFSMCK